VHKGLIVDGTLHQLSSTWDGNNARRGKPGAGRLQNHIPFSTVVSTSGLGTMHSSIIDQSVQLICDCNHLLVNAIKFFGAGNIRGKE
jgi:hypothetical protein